MPDPDDPLFFGMVMLLHAAIKRPYSINPIHNTSWLPSQSRIARAIAAKMKTKPAKLNVSVLDLDTDYPRIRHWGAMINEGVECQIAMVHPHGVMLYIDMASAWHAFNSFEQHFPEECAWITSVIDEAVKQ